MLTIFAGGPLDEFYSATLPQGSYTHTESTGNTIEYILYFDDARKLVSQQRDVPPCTLGDSCPSYPSHVPARYVLELNAGHSLIKALAAKAAAGDIAAVTAAAPLLFGQARILDGEAPSDPAAFAASVASLLEKSLA